MVPTGFKKLKTARQKEKEKFLRPEDIVAHTMKYGWPPWRQYFMVFKSDLRLSRSMNCYETQFLKYKESDISILQNSYIIVWLYYCMKNPKVRDTLQKSIVTSPPPIFYDPCSFIRGSCVSR